MDLLNNCLAKLEVKRTMIKLRHDERGVTALEYGMIAALIAVVIVAAITGIGTNLKAAFETIKDKTAA